VKDSFLTERAFFFYLRYFFKIPYPKMPIKYKIHAMGSTSPMKPYTVFS
jgi:hypothetical protein